MLDEEVLPLPVRTSFLKVSILENFEVVTNVKPMSWRNPVWL